MQHNAIDDNLENCWATPDPFSIGRHCLLSKVFTPLAGSQCSPAPHMALLGFEKEV